MIKQSIKKDLLLKIKFLDDYYVQIPRRSSQTQSFVFDAHEREFIVFVYN